MVWISCCDTIYALTIYPSLYNQQIRTFSETHIVFPLNFINKSRQVVARATHNFAACAFIIALAEDNKISVNQFQEIPGGVQ